MKRAKKEKDSTQCSFASSSKSNLKTSNKGPSTSSSSAAMKPITFEHTWSVSLEELRQKLVPTMAFANRDQPPADQRELPRIFHMPTDLRIGHFSDRRRNMLVEDHVPDVPEARPAPPVPPRAGSKSEVQPMLESPPFGSADDIRRKFFVQIHPRGFPDKSETSQPQAHQHNQHFKKSGALRLFYLGEEDLHVEMEVRNRSRKTYYMLSEATGGGVCGRSPLSGEFHPLDLPDVFIWVNVHFVEDPIDQLLNYEPSAASAAFNTVEFSLRIHNNRVNDTPTRCVLSDFGALRKKSRFTDVTLRCGPQGKEEITAHKAILAARSPVFEAMFDTDAYTESGENSTVDIVDISGEIMQVLLDHIYTGDVSRVKDYAMELLEAADKYDIKSLVPVCITWMRDNLSVDNAAQIFAMADAHSLDELTTAAIDFINAHHTEVMSTPGWRLHIRSRVELLEMLYVGKLNKTKPVEPDDPDVELVAILEYPYAGYRTDRPFKREWN